MKTYKIVITQTEIVIRKNHYHKQGKSLLQTTEIITNKSFSWEHTKSLSH